MPVIDTLTAVLKLDSGGFQKGINSATQSMGKLGNSFNSVASGSSSRLKNSLSSLGSVAVTTGKSLVGLGVAATAGFGWAAKTAADIDSIQRGLNFATGSAGDGAAAFSYLSEQSDRLGISVEVAAKSFKGLAAASIGTVLEGDQVRDVWLSVAEASSVMGLSTQQTELALVALTQMVNKGVISAEEFRQQLAEHIPGASNAMARALGVSTAKLSKMMETGALISERVLPKFASELRKMVSPDVEAASDSLRASIARMKNEWFLVKAAVLDSDAQVLLQGGIKFLTAQISKIPGIVEEVASAWKVVRPPVMVVVNGLGMMVRDIFKLIHYIGDLFELMASIGSLISDVWVTSLRGAFSIFQGITNSVKSIAGFMGIISTEKPSISVPEGSPSTSSAATEGAMAIKGSGDALSELKSIAAVQDEIHEGSISLADAQAQYATSIAATNEELGVTANSAAIIKETVEEIPSEKEIALILTSNSDEAIADTEEFVERYKESLSSISMDAKSQIQNLNAEIGIGLTEQTEFFDKSYEERKAKAQSMYETFLAQARTAFGQEEALAAAHTEILNQIDQAHLLKKEAFYSEQNQKIADAYMKTFEESNAEVLSFAENTADKLGNTFVDALMGDKPDFSAVMKDIAKDALKQLYKVLFSQKIMEQFKSMLMGGAQAGAGGIGGMAAAGAGVGGGAGMGGMLTALLGVGGGAAAVMSEGNGGQINEILENFQLSIAEYVGTIFSKMQNVIESVISSVPKLFSLIKELIAKIMSMFKSFTSSIGGGEGGGIGSLFGSLTSLLGFAKGGVINEQIIGVGLKSGAGYTIGEAGPEAIIPMDNLKESGAERVFPTNSGALGGSFKNIGDQSGSSKNVNAQSTSAINISINAVDSKSVVELMRRTPEAITGPIIEALQLGNRGLGTAIKGAVR